MRRRDFMTFMFASAVILPLTGKGYAMGFFDKKGRQEDASFPFKLSDEEWKKRLSDEAYRVLRKHGTERSGTSPLNNEKRNGSYLCAGCDHELFSSAHKFDSGTGWPSFWQPANEASIGTSEDHKLLMTRTEVHCANCGGHLGHVFNDGPPPTGLRYCMNGVAMKFIPS